MVLSPLFIIISQVINLFISTGHKGCISMIKLSEITVDVKKHFPFYVSMFNYSYFEHFIPEEFCLLGYNTV
jgi:hypothetical protein